MAIGNFRDNVLIRVYAVAVIIVVVALTIFFKASILVTREGDKWRKEADKRYIQNREVPGERGNILAEDGSLMATSIPYFEIRMDFGADGLSKEEFVKNLDSLAWCLTTYLTPEKGSIDEWKNYLWTHSVAKSRYELIAKDITFDQLSVMKTFPVFRGGRSNGFIPIRTNRREHPFKNMALRTLGYTKDDLKVGLEGKFDKELSGGKENVPMIRVGNDVWVPLQDLTDIEPRNGDDLVTTIDVNMQDITQTALIRSCDVYQAEHGTAIVMEVKTGKIKAISNVTRTKEGGWVEDYNYAVGVRVEPGSTWKLASMLALLEEKAVRLSDTVNIEGGRKLYSDVYLEDHEKARKNLMTVKEAFSASSNVGVSKLVYNYFNDKRQAYIKHLQDFNLTIPTGIELDGEAPPNIKNADDATWSGITLPWMSVGYELEITPLQLLTFYNAVANNGVMMKPYLVSEIRRYNETQKYFRPTIVNKRIASPDALSQARELLESVVELPGGTAYHLRTPQYRFAGKTGTAQLNYSKDKIGKHTGGYLGSFVGYFPAENPIYSCVVMVSKPKSGHYGGIVAAPVFREIADKLISSNIALSEPVNQRGKPVPSPASLPNDVGFKGDLLKMLQNVGLKHEIGGTKDDDWSALKAKSDTLNVTTRNVGNIKKVPSVVGMGLKDALYLLENRGLRVSFSGYGKVIAQSLNPGSPAFAGNVISIKLD